MAKPSFPSSIRDRVVLYTTPAVTFVLLAAAFYQLILHRAQLLELQRLIKPTTAPDSDTSIHSPDVKLLSRYSRGAISDDLAALNHYFGAVAERQVSI